MDMKNYTAKQNVRGRYLAKCKKGSPTRDYCARKFGKQGVPNAKKKPLSICVLLFMTLLRAHCQIDIAEGFIAGQDLAKKQCDSTGIALDCCQLH